MNKNNKIWIDLFILKQVELSLNEYLTLLSIYYSKFNKTNIPFKYSKETVQSLHKKEWIEVYEEPYRKKLKTKAIKLIIRLNKNKGKVDINKEFIKEFREKWKGLKLGTMGSIEACRNKLGRWKGLNPEYSEEEILKAADLYIHSLKGDYKYLQRADYFIYKREGKEESSRLSAFIDEVGDNNIITDEWTSTLN